MHYDDDKNSKIFLRYLLKNHMLIKKLLKGEDAYKATGKDLVQQ